MAELSNVLNRMERPTVGSKDNKAVFEGTLETGGGTSLKGITKEIIATNSSGDPGSNDYAFLPIHDAGEITEFTAVVSGAGIGSSENLMVAPASICRLTLSSR